MRHFYLFCGLLAAGSLLARPSAGQALDNTFVAPTTLYSTGTVDVLGPAQADGKRLVGGYFTRLNGVAVTSGLVRLEATGAVDQAFLQNVGNASTPYRIRRLANGQYLLQGQATSLVAGGLTRNELLRLNANGTADASFDVGMGPNDASNFGYTEDVVAQPDGKLLVSGAFDVFNGQPAHSLVRLNANGGVDNTFSAGAGPAGSGYADVLTLAVQADGKILAGGIFSSFNGQPAAALVRLNANGSVDPTFTSPLALGDYVYNLLVQPDGSIVVNGELTRSSTHTSVVRLLPSGSFDPGFTLSPALGATVFTSYQEPPVALQPDGKLVVVGSFDLPGYRHVARLNTDGSLDFAFQATVGPNNYPSTLGLQPDGSILLGGNFTAVGSTETALVQLTSAGPVDAGFAASLQLPGSVDALVRQADGSVLVGGNFTEWNGVAVHRVARLSATGVLDAAYVAASSPLTGNVTALLLQPDGKAVVGTYNGLYRLLASGTPDPAFTQSLPYSVYVTGLAQQADGKLLVAGSVGGLGGGAPYSRLTRLTTSGNFDGTFTAPTSSVGAVGLPSAVLVQQDGRILLASNGSNTTNRISYVQRYEANGATDASWTVPAFTLGTNQARVARLVQQPDGQVLVGGRFTSAAGTSHSNITRLGSTGTVDTGFSPGSTVTATGNGVVAVAVQPNGRILLGGGFQATGPAGTYYTLLRLLPTGQLDATFSNAANPSGQVSTIAVQPDGGILLQGGFTTVAGQARRNVARITAPNVLAVAAPAAVAATALWPVPAHDVLRVLPAATAHPQAAELLDALGRVVQQRALAGPGEFSLDTSMLPAGLYVLRLRYAEGTVSRQVAVE